MTTATATEVATYVDLPTEELMNWALKHEGANLGRTNTLIIKTGKRTGRSPKDRFIIKDAITANTIEWGEVNRPIEDAKFNALWEKATEYLRERPHFVGHHRVGAGNEHFLPVEVITETASQALFAHHMFIQPEGDWAAGRDAWTLMSAPGLLTDPAIDGVHSDGVVMINFTQRKVLLCGMPYSGEIKKAMFSVMNYLLPAHDVLPMHCAANRGEDGDTALFFGLSGTGKTTLSADPERYLIGDDEHGWSSTGIFNFEGGCYAKCINLDRNNEPVIWDAIRDSAILENVVTHNGQPDYTDTSLTQNTRAAYPREHIERRIESNQGKVPKAVLFLTCDLYGVLPPVALLTKEQAAYYFLSGYTALVGSTEMGSTSGIKTTFSTCFGAPFFPRPATEYAELLMKRVEESGAQVYLVNTGWQGGAYGEGGSRYDIPTTRAIVDAAISGELLTLETESYPGFGFQIPAAMEGMAPELINPQLAWQDGDAFQRNLSELIEQFKANFKRFDVPQAIADAGPR